MHREFNTSGDRIQRLDRGLASERALPQLGKSPLVDFSSHGQTREIGFLPGSGGYGPEIAKTSKVEVKGIKKTSKKLLSDKEGQEALSFIGAPYMIEKAWSDYDDAVRRERPLYPDYEAVTKAATEYLARKPVGYEIRPGENGENTEYQFALGGQTIAQIRIYLHGNGNSAEIDNFDVVESLQRQGFGGRLMRSSVRFMKDNGVTDLYSRNISKKAFDARIAIFGAENLHFYYTAEQRAAGAKGDPPKTVEEARKILADAYDGFNSGVLGENPHTFGIRVNLNDMDTSRWEQAVPAKVSSDQVILS